MATGHDKKCTNCKGSGERLLQKWVENEWTPDGLLFQVRGFRAVIVECSLCSGTGLIELDEYWEHG